ncbi:MAG: hypothetical protein P4L28_00265 [Paludibacteraceae bacterium]|nr:hypothetical protein [Paludibacteraceae bacterium]
MRICVIILFCSLISIIKAQELVPSVCDVVYRENNVTTRAEFPDGEEEMYNIIYKSLIWQCGDKSYGGTVLVDFIVDRTGHLWNVKVERPIAPCFDDDIIKAVKATKHWKPATLGGFPVCSERSISVRIRLGFQ